MGLRIFGRTSSFGLATAAVAAAIGLLGSPAVAAPAEGTILDAGTPTVVPGSYVVILKPTTTVQSQGAEPTARNLAGQYGGQVKQVYNRSVQGFAVTMSETRAKQLAANPAVQYVQRNGVYRVSGVQPNPLSPGLDRIDQRKLPLDRSYTYPSTAATVHAYIIDTGIRIDHTTFGGRATIGKDVVGDGRAPLGDCHGHGTHVAGTVGGAEYGVAKGVALVGVRVLDCNGSGTSAGVIAGIEWVTANAIKPAVANMSLGGGGDTALDNAVKASIKVGITYAVAAGNSNADACGTSPARVSEAITVGATDQADNRAYFSNLGSCLDIFAPGVNIVSAGLASPTATATMNGTSMASPHVAGAAALVLAAHPSWSPQQVRDAIVDNATTGVVAGAGAGSANRLLFVGTATAPMPPPVTCSASSATDVKIPDAGAKVTSAVTISGCSRAASATSKVEVHVVHPYRGDIGIDLVSPDGVIYKVRSPNIREPGANLSLVQVVDVSAANVVNGTWTLQVRDAYRYDVGYLDSWSLTL